MFASSARCGKAFSDRRGPQCVESAPSSTDSAGPNEPRPSRDGREHDPTMGVPRRPSGARVGRFGRTAHRDRRHQALLAAWWFALPVTDCVAVPRVHTPTDEASP